MDFIGSLVVIHLSFERMGNYGCKIIPSSDMGRTARLLLTGDDE
jgi:hypothetical protein